VGFGTSVGATNMQGDSDVDGGDFLAYQRQLGRAASVRTSTNSSSAVPEPCGSFLLMVGILAGAWREAGRRRGRTEG